MKKAVQAVQAEVQAAQKSVEQTEKNLLAISDEAKSRLREAQQEAQLARRVRM